MATFHMEKIQTIVEEISWNVQQHYLQFKDSYGSLLNVAV